MTISTTTSVTEAVRARLEAAEIQASIKENAILASLCHEANTEGLGQGLTGQYLYADGLSAAAPATEGAATTATEFTLTEATSTASEFTVAVELSQVSIDSTGGSKLFDAARMEITAALLDQVESTVGALASGFTGASQSVSDTGVAIDFTDMLTMKTNLRLNAKGRASNAVFVLYDNCVKQLQLRTLDVTYGLSPALSREGLISILGDTPNSAVLGAQAGSFMGIPVLQSTHIPSANSGADSANMLIVAGQGGAIMINHFWRVMIKIAETTVNGKFGLFMLGGVCFGAAEARDVLGVTGIFDR